MKKTFLLIHIFFFATFWAQVKHFDVQWKLPLSEKQTSVPPDAMHLIQEHQQYRVDNLYFAAVWQENSMINPASVRLENIQMSPVASSLINRMKYSHLPDSFKPVLQTSFAREKIYATFEVNAFIRKNGQYYKLDAFDIRYEYGTNSYRRPAQNIYDSRWASGDWYKIHIDRSGVYKISRKFLKDLGIDVQNLDPRKIKIFGNGGKVMPLLNSDPYPEDIAEVAIQVIGEQDGSFDSDDYILFYAQSDKEWSNDYDSNLNIYTEQTDYFIQIDGQDGKRMQVYQEPAGSPVTTFTDYLARSFYEKDKTIFTYMGRRAFDEPMNVSSNSKTYEFDIPNRLTSKPVYYKVKAATNKNGTAMSVSINGQAVGSANFSISGYNIGADASVQGNLMTASNPVKVSLTYQNNNLFDALMYLDYINIWAYASLVDTGGQFPFYHPDADTGTGLVAYHFTNASNITQIWDITDMYNPTYKTNSQATFEVKFLKENKKRFVAVNPAGYYTPEKPDNPKQSNQNLHKEVFYHTGSFKDLDYLIVTPSFLHEKAEKFAEMHRQMGLNVYVADLKNIYKEFGNGEQDIAAIRNMIKYIYKNATAPDKRIKYVMLFGDASNDFKNLISENLLTDGTNSNIVPIYESLDAFHLVTSIASDDFFVLMDDNEGRLASSSEKPDIAVGRLLVRNNEEAETIFEKYQHYLSLTTKQNWRSFVTLWSDDADSGPGHYGDKEFEINTEAIAQGIKQWHPEYNVSKIYQDAYQQINTPGGPRYPDAKRDLFNTFEKGTLILAYIGHGNEVALSHERMLTMQDVLNLHNFDRLPLMTTMTCEFAKFDNPTRETAAEHLIWNPSGGVLEMVSTVREIWTSNARFMNTDFYTSLFGLSATLNGQIIHNPAEALRQAKIITTSGTGLFNIAFLGDPGFELGFARPKIKLTSVNNMPTDTLRALQRVRIKGEVQDANGQLLTGFNGTINPIVFDKYKNKVTLDNDHINFTMPFQQLGSKLFQGKADVVNGQFSFEFVVPKDIDLNYGKGRISFYAVNNDTEKIGFDETITVGGVDPNAEADDKPPVIKAYMNDTNFVPGGVTDANPYLVLHLEDEHGINTIGGIGHDITAYLDDDQTNVFILNDFYETENNTYQRGKVRYRLYNLKPGWHTLHIKAWDVYNNSGMTEIDFQVVENKDIVLEHVLNYPNPFVNYTEFWFNHNHPFEDLDVMIQVYTISGKLVWQHHQSVNTTGYLSREITWDGRDSFGNKLAKGVYVYKLTVRSLSGKSAQKIEKLVIL